MVDYCCRLFGFTHVNWYRHFTTLVYDPADYRFISNIKLKHLKIKK